MPTQLCQFLPTRWVAGQIRTLEGTELETWVPAPAGHEPQEPPD